MIPRKMRFISLDVQVHSRHAVDSAGLGVVVYAYGTLNQKNGALRLCGVSPRILSLLQLTKTDTFLAINPRREQSLAALPV